MSLPFNGGPFHPDGNVLLPPYPRPVRLSLDVWWEGDRRVVGWRDGWERITPPTQSL